MNNPEVLTYFVFLTSLMAGLNIGLLFRIRKIENILNVKKDIKIPDFYLLDKDGNETFYTQGYYTKY